MNRSIIPFSLQYRVKRSWLGVFTLLFLASSISTSYALSDTPKTEDQCNPGISYDINNPDYSKENIYRHVHDILLNQKLPNNQRYTAKFHKWERPIRYYIKGLDDHPKYKAILEEKIKEASEITGIEANPHPGIFLEYNEEKFNNKEEWPDELSTNVVLIFSKSLKESYNNKTITNFFKATKTNVTSQLEIHLNNPNTDFTQIVNDISGLRAWVSIISFKRFEENRNRFASKASNLSMSINGIFRPASHAPSILNPCAHKLGILDLTPIDILTLKYLYNSRSIKSGYPLGRVVRNLSRRISAHDYLLIGKSK